MDDTRGSETPGEMLARRLADAVGPGSQIDERAATEENELRCLLGNQSLTAPLPSIIPDFIGSEHEVWSDGEWVIKATLPGAFGRRWGSRRFALFSEYLERLTLTRAVFALNWEFMGLALEMNRIRILTRQPFFKGVAPTKEEITTFMEAFGFIQKQHRFGDFWLMSGKDILVYDAEPGNFVKTSAGLVPIDLIMQKTGQELLDQ